MTRVAGIRELRASLKAVLEGKDPVIVRQEHAYPQTPRAIIIPLLPFEPWDTKAKRAAITKARQDFSHAISELQH